MLAIPLAGATVAGMKLQAMPATGAQVNVTLSANPPAGVTVSMNGVERPAFTIAAKGDAAREKSALAISMATVADVLRLICHPLHKTP